MSQILFLILATVIVLVAVFLIGKHSLSNISSLIKVNEERKKNKAEAKNKILELLKKKSEISNSDVKNLLSVSDATATRYLGELEKERKISQRGKTGKWVFYVKI